MSTLYELRELRDLLDEALKESGGELTPELEQQLMDLDVATDEKIERVGLYIREQLAQASAIEGEAKRLQDRANAKANAANSLKLYLQREMERLGKENVNGLLCTVTLQNNPPSVKGDVDAFTLGNWWVTATLENFVRHTPESFSLNRQAVITAYKAGQFVPAELTIEQTRSVRIR